jgi:hypothetical protein
MQSFRIAFAFHGEPQDAPRQLIFYGDQTASLPLGYACPWVRAYILPRYAPIYAATLSASSRSMASQRRSSKSLKV